MGASVSRGISADALDPEAVLEVCLCHNVRRAARAITRGYDAALAPAGLTAGQFVILAAVGTRQAMPMPTLRTLLAMDRTSLARTIKPLIYRGLVAVTAGAGRRSGHVTLTDEGRGVFRDAGPYWRAAQASASAQIGMGRAGQLIAGLAAATEQLL